MSQFVDFINKYNSFSIIQAENPDGDSLGSALGLEAILNDMDKSIDLYCPVDIPKYLRYVSGWDRVSDDFNTKNEAAIIVDTSANTLLSKVLANPTIKNFLNSKPILVIDHHQTNSSDLEFNHQLILDDKAIATGQMIAEDCFSNDLQISADAATALTIAMLSDSLGLTTQATNARSVHTVANLLEHGASIADIEQARREYMKKSAEILAYKGRLIERISYHVDNKLALVHIPWEEIEQYSDQYNPSVLVLDEMRLVEGVEVAIAIKTYPDGKLTGKIRSNLPISDKIAGYFGGGGHAYAAGFRTYEQFEQILPDLIKAVEQAGENN